MRTYSQLRIAPFTALLDSPSGGDEHCGGPVFEDWHNEVASRHCRYDTSPIDVLPPAPALEPKIRSGEFAYLGPISHHFGHQVCEFSMRITPTKLSGFEGQYVFGTRPGRSVSLRYQPRFFREIVSYFRLPENRITIINEQTVLEKVSIAPQAETLFGRPPTDQFLEALESHFGEVSRANRAEVPKCKVVYISRSRLNRGIFAGELALEHFMRRGGALVVYPEITPLEQLLLLYAEADYIVGAEGSALHTVQLLGRQVKNLIVIRRRMDGHFFAENALRSRSLKVSYVDAVVGGLSGNSKRRWRETGLVVLSFDRLKAQLRELLPLNFSAWSKSEFESGMAASFNQWIAGFISTQNNPDALSILREEAEQLDIKLDPQGVALLMSASPARDGAPLASILSDLDSSTVAANEMRIACIFGLSDAPGYASAAVEAAQKLLDADSAYPLTADQLGRVASHFWAKKCSDLALRAIYLAVGRNPDQFFLWQLKAHIDMGCGNITAAEAAALRASALDPGRPEVWFLLSVIDYKNGKYERSLERIQRAINDKSTQNFIQHKQMVQAAMEHRLQADKTVMAP